MKLIIGLLIVVLIAGCSTTSQKSLTRIAHRGASGHVPEHTLVGAAMAHAWNVDFIEADLVMTKDNHLIVRHDLELDTTTDVAKVFPSRKRADGRYYAIDFTVDEIKRLRAMERFDPKTGKRVFPERFADDARGFTVPTFEEFVTLVQSLNRARKMKTGIYPEIKKPEFHQKEGKDIVRAVIEAVRRHGYEERPTEIYLQSFEPGALKRLKSEFKTQIPLVQLLGENSWKESSADYDAMKTDEGLKAIAEYAKGFGPNLGTLRTNPTLFARAKAAGLVVHPYTHRADQRPLGFTNEAYIRMIRESGADGIFSDFAELF